MGNISLSMCARTLAFVLVIHSQPMAFDAVQDSSILRFSLFLLLQIFGCHFTFLHLIWSSFCALSQRFYLSYSLSFSRSPPVVVIKYLKWRKGCLTSNMHSLFFILLLSVSAARHTWFFYTREELSLCVSPSFFFLSLSVGSRSI